MLARLLHVLTLLALVATLGPVALSSSASSRTFLVGVDEDAPKWGRSHSVAAVSRTLGLKAIRITVPWEPGESRLSSAERRTLGDAVVTLSRLRIVVAVYGAPEAAPQDEPARLEFCDFAADIVRRFPSIRDVVVWNEPNNARFWLPQFAPDGTSLAPSAYEALLATCWSKFHSVAPGVNVIAPSAPRGSSRVRAGRSVSHAPGPWYRGLGAAYRKSGRRKPIFDTVGHNPYPDFTSERPWTRHPNSQSIAQGDHDKLVAALRQAFRGTAQPLPGTGRVTIWYLEQGFQTRPDPQKEQLYSGTENDRFVIPAWSSRAGSRQGLAPDQTTQLVDSIRLAYCQRDVGAYFNFMLADEHDLEGWQSGVLWSDWTPKPSYSAFSDVVREVNAGKVDCSTLSELRSLPTPQEPEPLAISDVKISSLSPFSATISWRTSFPSPTRLEASLFGSEPTMWHLAEGARREHDVSLSGLSFSSSYSIWISAIGPDGQQAQASLTLRTPRLPESVQASVARGVGALLLNGEPFFPLMVWSQCPTAYAASLAVGITLFAENPCGGLRDQLNALGGRALSAAVSGRPGASGPGLIGYFHPDEADAVGLTAATLPAPPAGAEDGLSFLTLSNHFYSELDQLSGGRDVYPGLVEASDVVGFDLFPLQEFCRPERLADVYSAQKELAQLARGKPTFQWIEASGWRCPTGQTAVTPATVRAEAWLAIAGGARGLGFFPATWTPTIGRTIAAISRDVGRLGPALFSFPTPATVTSSGGEIKVGARAYRDTLYLVAVNASWEPAEATISLPGLQGRRLTVLDEARSLSPDGEAFSDSFAPLQTHIYVAPPPGFSPPGR